MGDPERGNKWLANDTFSKSGLTYDDHHFKSPTGEYEYGPPSHCKTLYHQGPPAKLVIRGPINSLKCQSHCMGVYKLMPNITPNGAPCWKHVDEDLCIAASKINGEDGWVIAQFSTFSSKEKRCMSLAGDKMPFNPKRDVHSWMEWDGRNWINTSVKCRASPHGYGQAGVEGQAEHDNYLDKRGGSPTRARRSPPSSPLRQTS
jgi:hypothetical protein